MGGEGRGPSEGQSLRDDDRAGERSTSAHLHQQPVLRQERSGGARRTRLFVRSLRLPGARDREDRRALDRRDRVLPRPARVRSRQVQFVVETMQGVRSPEPLLGRVPAHTAPADGRRTAELELPLSRLEALLQPCGALDRAHRMGGGASARIWHPPNRAACPTVEILNALPSSSGHGRWMNFARVYRACTAVHMTPDPIGSTIETRSDRLHPDLIHDRVHSGTPGYPVARIGIAITTWFRCNSL